MIQKLISPKFIFGAAALCLPYVSASAFAIPISFSGNKLPVIETSAASNSGLNAVYVIYDITGVSLNFQSESYAPVKFFRFSNLGGGYAEEINDITVDNKNYILSTLDSDTGYIIQEGEKFYYLWIIDYQRHLYDITDISISDDSNCDVSVLNVNGSANVINYYGINGRKETLDRDIKVEYSNLIWNQDNMQFDQEKIVTKLPYISNSISLISPIYCTTPISISGDRFLAYWNIEKTISTQNITPVAVSVVTEAIQNSSDADISNRIENDTDGLGGSAPCDIDFNAFVTDACIHYEWQMATDENFDNITYRINSQDFSYTFNEEGITYIRFIGSNNDGSCESYGDVYTVNIGASELLIPNVFSPGDDGINDEWKVSYRSIIDFNCWIFDRQGHEITHFNSPDKGWDGKRNGKYVKPGVYYYVIQATGSDGKRYKKSGDINILKYRGSGASNSSSENME